MTKDKALKLALEALEAHADIGIKSDKAITAIKEALAQPARTGWPEGLLQDDDRKLSKWLASKPDAKHVVDMAQPALCKYGNEVQGCTSSPMNCQCCFDSLDDLDEELAQEPVLLNGLTEDETNATASVMGLTAPQQRPWVGLTDADMYEIVRPLCNSDQSAKFLLSVSKDEYQAIEAKLKEKNT